MSSNKKSTKRQLNGILLLNKAKGFSSNQSLQKAKRMFKANKAGHTGNLDPLATGMLPICFGEASKFSHFLLDADKTYATTAQLGESTGTGDAEGEVVETAPVPELSEALLQSVFAKFIGEIEQIPPMYSALKHEGQPLYKLARQGINVERKIRRVKIYAIELLDYTDDSFFIKVQCSKGTYIRTLVEDIAKALGTVAYVSLLHRISVAPFLNNAMHSIDELENLEDLDSVLFPVDAGLIEFPKLVLTGTQVCALQHGQPVLNIQQPSCIYRLYSELEQFIGMGEITSESKLISKRLLTTLC